MTTTNRTDTAALIALSKLGHLNLASNKDTKAMRADLPPGTYKGNATIDIAYEVKVGQDHEAEVSQSVPWQKIAGALLARVNESTRRKVIEDLLTDNGDGTFSFDDEQRGDDAEALLKEIMGSTRKVVAGKITGKTLVMNATVADNYDEVAS
jgi:Na+/citrate or Na+/malate symporter